MRRRWRAAALAAAGVPGAAVFTAAALLVEAAPRAGCVVDLPEARRFCNGGRAAISPAAATSIPRPRPPRRARHVGRQAGFSRLVTRLRP